MNVPSIMTASAMDLREARHCIRHRRNPSRQLAIARALAGFVRVSPGTPSPSGLDRLIPLA